MDGISDLESLLGIKLPAGYRRFSENGYLDLRASDDVYLWVHEAEWIPAADIPDYDLGRGVLIPDLVPFAFTGRGDHWCWHTQVRSSAGEYEVLLCPRGERSAFPYAPSFPAWFYRTGLDFASSLDREPEFIEEARTHLRRWSTVLCEIGPEEWGRHLASLATATPFEYHPPRLREGVIDFGLISSAEVDEIVNVQFGRRYLLDEVRWRD